MREVNAELACIAGAGIKRINGKISRRWFSRHDCQLMDDGNIPLAKREEPLIDGIDFKNLIDMAPEAHFNDRVHSYFNAKRNQCREDDPPAVEDAGARAQRCTTKTR